MRRVAILIAGAGNDAFYSQIAAAAAGVRALNWRRWQPSIHVYLGTPEPGESNDRNRWIPFLADIDISDVTPQAVRQRGHWAQVDATFELAPPGADVLMSLDADTLPVESFEDVLDRVAEEDLIAGVMAHYPPPPGATPRDDWMRAANGLTERPLVFSHEYSLLDRALPDEQRAAPFYVNGGVMFYGRRAFERFVPLYLELRSKLSERIADEAFAGQVAATLAVTEAELKTWALPIRYNFPNDAVAERLHPHEAGHVVIYHYLRTGRFDRHRIFTTRQAYDEFLSLPLDGPDLGFQRAVRRVLGSDYPFD